MHTIESLLASIISRKGDLSGHEFHGNQFSGGGGSSDSGGEGSSGGSDGGDSSSGSGDWRKGSGGRSKLPTKIGKTPVKGPVSADHVNEELDKGPMSLQISGRTAVTFTKRDDGSIRTSGRDPVKVTVERISEVINEATGFKAGARHSSGDKKNLQAIHDASVDLGASCPMLVFKQDNGKYRWLTFSSTAFQDRDREIISTKAQEDDCNYLNKTGDYGPLRWWHVGKPIQTNSKDWRSWNAGVGLDIGRCDFSAMHGRVRIESGTFYDERVGARMKEISNNLSVSIGYSHLSDEPKGGIFEHSHTFERSFLPLGRQSNYFASIPVIQKESTMDNEKLTKFRELMGPLAELVLGKAEATEKAAESTGLSFKEKVSNMTEEEFKEFLQEAVTKAANPFAKPDPDEPDDDEEMTDEEKKVAADKKKKKDGEMTKKETDLATALSAIQTALQTTQKDAQRIDLALKQAQENDVKIAQAMQQMNEAQKKSEKAIKSLLGDLSKSVAKGYRASQSDDTVTDETKAKEAGPGQKDSAFSNFLDFAVSGSTNGNQPPAG